MKITSHRTHKGEIITGDRLDRAIKSVAQEWRALGQQIRNANDYGAHVSESKKDEILEQHLKCADELESGKSVPSFTFWQRINQKLTGDCVGFLPSEGGASV